MHFFVPGHLGGKEPRSYRRYDLVRCEACSHVFLAQGKHVSCRRCKGELLRPLRH